MRRIFAIWAVCLCWGILNAAPLGPFNATLLEQLKNDYQKGEKEVTRYIELQEKVAEKYIKMTPLSVTAKKKLDDWATAFCYWMENSTQGQRESHAANNHGLWYEAIHLMVLAYLDRTDRIREVAEQSILPKMGAQIADDGSLPQELKRTLSLHYSTFALEALMEANQITSQIGINLWSTPASNGKVASQAVDYLYPFYLNPEDWKFKQIKPFDQSRAAILLYEAGTALGNQKYVDTAKRIGLKYSTSDVETIPYLVLKKK